VINEREIGEKFETLAPFSDEVGRRMWAATEARALGRGGVSAVHRATGIAKSTLYRGISDLESGHAEELANEGGGAEVIAVLVAGLICRGHDGGVCVDGQSLDKRDST